MPRLVDELPLFALLGAFAHGTTRGDRRRGAAREGERPDRDGDRARCARSASGSQARPRRLLGARRARRGRAAARSTPRGDHRIAMLGAVAGVVSREGVRLEGAESRGDKLPRLLRPARPTSPGRATVPGSRRHDDPTRCPTPVHRSAEQPRDRRHRRPRRRRQEHGRARARRAARLPLPRHRRDVPRASPGSRSSAGCRSATGTLLGALARENPVTFDERGPRASSPTPT